MRVLLSIGLLCGSIWASGYLSLETNPAGVEVWYSMPGGHNMKYLGDSPLDSRELPPGTYDLWLINGGKDTVSVPNVIITEGQHSDVTHDMPANYGTLKIHTDPDSGEIWLDGVKLGSSPYLNNLVLPGTYTLKLVPPSSMYRMREEKVIVHKGDTLNFDRPFSFRDKSFFEENLSVRPWVVQLEEGYQYGSVFGAFDTSGKRNNFPNSDKKKQNDFPLTLRMGFPYGLEAHLQVPFQTYTPSDSAAPIPRDLSFGLKYTYRPLGVALDASYSVGTSASNGGFNHDRLILTAIGDYAMNKVLLQANGGYQFHFADKDSSDLDPGDVVFLNARVGYAADAFLPYLGVLGHFTLAGSQGDSTVAGGYLVSLEPGLVFDDADFFSLQLGIPFAVLGQNGVEYWAIHFSGAIRFGFL